MVKEVKNIQHSDLPKSQYPSIGAELESRQAQQRNEQGNAAHRSAPRATHYVVKADQIGATHGRHALEKGDVVEVGLLGEDIDRFIGCDAVRPATPDESIQGHIHVADGSEKAASYEAQIGEGRRQLASRDAALADKDAEISRLRGLVGAGNNPDPSKSQGFKDVMKHKDDVIDRLTKENAALREQAGKSSEVKREGQ